MFSMDWISALGISTYLLFYLLADVLEITSMNIGLLRIKLYYHRMMDNSHCIIQLMNLAIIYVGWVGDSLVLLRC